MITEFQCYACEQVVPADNSRPQPGVRREKHTRLYQCPHCRTWNAVKDEAEA